MTMVELSCTVLPGSSTRLEICRSSWRHDASVYQLFTRIETTGFAQVWFGDMILSCGIDRMLPCSLPQGVHPPPSPLSSCPITPLYFSSPP